MHASRGVGEQNTKSELRKLAASMREVAQRCRQTEEALGGDSGEPGGFQKIFPGRIFYSFPVEK